MSQNSETSVLFFKANDEMCNQWIRRDDVTYMIYVPGASYVITDIFWEDVDREEKRLAKQTCHTSDFYTDFSLSNAMWFL